MTFALQRNRARLNGHKDHNGHFAGLDLRNSVAQMSSWIGTTFISCRFDGSAFGDATFKDCTFTKCSFEGATLVSRIYSSTFDRCSFDRALFVGAEIKDSTFKGCRAQMADFSRATVSRCKLDVDFRGACLNFSLTDDNDFTGSNLWSALIPFNCAMIYGNTFDERTIEAMIALLNYAKGPRALLDSMMGLVSERTVELVKRLVKAEDFAVDGSG